MCKEQLPFKLFGMNAAYYFVQVISHFLFECYKTDVTCDVVSKKQLSNNVYAENILAQGRNKRNALKNGAVLKIWIIRTRNFIFCAGQTLKQADSIRFLWKLRRHRPYFFGHFKIAQFRLMLIEKLIVGRIHMQITSWILQDIPAMQFAVWNFA